MPYAQEIASSCDLLLLQEHWLLGCQRELLHRSFDEWSNVNACIDDANPISQHCLPRGWGGIAILWRKSLNHLVRKTVSNSQKFIAITINQGNAKPTLLVMYIFRRVTALQRN